MLRIANWTIHTINVMLIGGRTMGNLFEEEYQGYITYKNNDLFWWFQEIVYKQQR